MRGYKAGMIFFLALFFLCLGWGGRTIVETKRAEKVIQEAWNRDGGPHKGLKANDDSHQDPKAMLKGDVAEGPAEEEAGRLLEKVAAKSEGRDRELALIPSYREDDVKPLTPDLVRAEEENLNFAVVKGHVQIPSVDIDLGIYEGINNANLLLGAAEQSPRTEIAMGGVGNYILCGHYCYWNRSYYFTNLKKVKAGDKVYVSNDDETFVYKVLWSKKVDKNDTTPINETSNEKWITLYTCGSFGNDVKDRWVVRGVLEE